MQLFTRIFQSRPWNWESAAPGCFPPAGHDSQYSLAKPSGHARVASSLLMNWVESRNRMQRAAASCDCQENKSKSNDTDGKRRGLRGPRPTPHSRRRGEVRKGCRHHQGEVSEGRRRGEVQVSRRCHRCGVSEGHCVCSPDRTPMTSVKMRPPRLSPSTTRPLWPPPYPNKLGDSPAPFLNESGDFPRLMKVSGLTIAEKIVFSDAALNNAAPVANRIEAAPASEEKYRAGILRRAAAAGARCQQVELPGCRVSVELTILFEMHNEPMLVLFDNCGSTINDLNGTRPAAEVVLKYMTMKEPWLLSNRKDVFLLRSRNYFPTRCKH